ncbi:hypothetical protein [Zobellia alginiliquefaciens]|uniref:hypothetical protein n=1 Tax=Zobellia alginiliquefaciens TaxID=3032586 RepID=UPI0023E38370|nr:hypothetical protein [Zobellia alginiliquefaciens]
MILIMADKNKIRTKLILEGLIAFFLAMIPLIFYFYKYIPAKSDASWNILWFEFTDNGYKDVATAFYFYIGKFVPLSLLIIWFITCKQWWYHVLLIPIAMYSFQLYSVLSEDITKIDENEILYLLGVCMVVIPIVYFIRLKLVDKYVHGIDLEAMEAELTALKKKQAARSSNAKLDKFISSEVSEHSPKEDQAKFEKKDTPSPTNNIESSFREVQHKLNNWLNLKF